MLESKIFRFRHHKISNPSNLKTKSKILFCPQFIDFNSPKNGSEECTHTEIMPAIPSPSSELLKVLEELHKLQSSTHKKRTRSRRRKSNTHNSGKISRINGFTAFKSYYSRSITSVCQGVISSRLSKVWQIEKNQDIWDNYARHYRRYKRTELFCDWLLRATQNTSVAKPKSSTSKSSNEEVVKDFIIEENLECDGDIFTTDFAPHSNSFTIHDSTNENTVIASGHPDPSYVNYCFDNLSSELYKNLDYFDINESHYFFESSLNEYDLFDDRFSDLSIEAILPNINDDMNKNFDQQSLTQEYNKTLFFQTPELWISLNTEGISTM